MAEFFQDEVGSTNFTELEDAPSSYTGQGGKAVFVKQTEDGLELQDVAEPAVTINDLTDVDTTGKSAGRILEFDGSGNMIVGDKSATASTSFTGLTDTPSDYVGQAGNVATVNQTEDGIVFSSVEGGGLVDSVFGRIGAVNAQAGDYDSDLITNESTIVGSSVTAALNTVSNRFTTVNNDLDDKIDKVTAGVTNNLLIRDSVGNAADSGIPFTTIPNKVDKIAGGTVGAIVTQGASGAIEDSGVSIADLDTSAIFNIEHYGAVANNFTDNKTAIDNAINDLTANGGGVLYIPASGIFRTSGNHPIRENMVVRGEGDRSVLKRTSGSTLPIFQYTTSNRPEIDRKFVSFEKVRFEGTFDETGEEGSGSIIVGVGLGHVQFTECKFWYADAFVLNLNVCDSVNVIHCEFWYNCRDVIAVWGTPAMVVAHNVLVGNDDDSISLNMARFESTNDTIRDGLIVTGNYLRDTGAIKIQQAKNTVISHNVIRQCKGGGAIFIEGETAATAGGSLARTSNFHNVIIDSNIIVDQVARTLSFEPAAGSINERLGIKIDTRQRTVREYEAPYQYNYTDSGASDERPVTESHTLLVTNNIITRTVQPDGVKTYSELYGFGPMFSRFKNAPQDNTAGYIGSDGFVDPVMQESYVKFAPMQIRDGLINARITDNYMQGSDDKCLWFDSFYVTTDRDMLLRDVIVEGNTFRDFERVGVDLADYAGTAQDVIIRRNTFDGDPYHLRPSRNADGSWSTLGLVVAIEMGDQSGIRVIENTFKNSDLAWSTDGGGSEGYEWRRNIFQGEPSTTETSSTFATTNKGMGIFPYTQDPELELKYVDSDPTSPTYLQSLGKTEVYRNVASPPSQGYYFKGQILPVRIASPSNGKILFAYKRNTDGNTHVLNTDWIPLYVDIAP